jgi:hypothetical protein
MAKLGEISQLIVALAALIAAVTFACLEGSRSTQARRACSFSRDCSSNSIER